MSLPSGFTALEYIESTGSQFIDTGIVPGANTKVVCEFEKSTTSNTSQYIFGCDKFSFYFNRSWLTYYSESGNKVSFQGPPADGKYTVTKEMLTAAMTDGTLSWTVETTASAPTRTMLIFAKANAYGTQDFASTKIYSFKVYNGTTLVRDYRPCKDPAGAVCMYDVMSGEYGYNAGTGVFVAGPATGEPEPQPPEAPINLRATVDGTVVTLTWDAPENAEQYLVYKDGTYLAGVTVTTYSCTVEAGATYRFGVRSWGSAGYGGIAEIDVEVPAEITPPAVPGNFRATLSNTTATLRWDAVADADGYKLYRDDALISTQPGTGFVDTVATGAVYRYSLTAYNAYGVSTAASLSVNVPYIPPSLELITDRTQADVDRWQALAAKGFEAMTEGERSEWLSGPKGAYNATDLNRVGEAVAYLAGRLTGYGYAVHVAPRTDWVIGDIPTPAQLTAYLADVAAIRAVLTVLSETPEVPERLLPSAPGKNDGLTYQKANDIEKILEDVDLLITLMMRSWYYCGEVFAGEV